MKRLKIKYLFAIIFSNIVLIELALAQETPNGEVKPSRIDSLLWTLMNKEVLMDIVLAILILIVTVYISRKVKEKLLLHLESWSTWEDAAREEVYGMVIRSVNATILIIWISTAIGFLGIDLGIFVWWLWFGIGLTLRGFMINFVAGITTILQWSYTKWDIISLGWEKWRIVKIDTLFTTVERIDGIRVHIPNSSFLEQTVINYTSNDKIRCEVEVWLDYGTDTVKAKVIVNKVLASLPNIMKAPMPSVVVTKLKDTSIILKVMFWINKEDNDVAIKSNVLETINMAFKQSDIKMYQPQLLLESLEK